MVKYLFEWAEGVCIHYCMGLRYCEKMKRDVIVCAVVISLFYYTVLVG